MVGPSSLLGVDIERARQLLEPIAFCREDRVERVCPRLTELPSRDRTQSLPADRKYRFPNNAADQEPERGGGR